MLTSLLLVVLNSGFVFNIDAPNIETGIPNSVVITRLGAPNSVLAPSSEARSP